MGEVRFMISEAAKQVKVESHVLRYWEEELDLNIGRTEMGHRYYTKDDIQLFRCIKKLKDEGMLLKDLKPLIPELKETRLKLQKSPEAELSNNTDDLKDTHVSNITPIKTSDHTKQAPSPVAHDEPAAAPSEAPSLAAAAPSTQLMDKPKRSSKMTVTEVIPVTQLEQVRTLIGDVLTEVVTNNNDTLKKDISKTVTREVIREMDFLFQAKERQEEEHFRKLDCLIRQQQASRRESARDTPIGRLKKLIT